MLGVVSIAVGDGVILRLHQIVIIVVGVAVQRAVRPIALRLAVQHIVKMRADLAFTVGDLDNVTGFVVDIAFGAVGAVIERIGLADQTAQVVVGKGGGVAVGVRDGGAVAEQVVGISCDVTLRVLALRSSG